MDSEIQVQEAAPAKQFDIHINLEGMTWGDLQLVMTYDGRITPDLIELCDHVVVGGVKKLPFLATVNDVMDEIMKAMSVTADPPSPSGN